MKNRFKEQKESKTLILYYQQNGIERSRNEAEEDFDRLVKFFELLIEADRNR